MVVTRRTSVPIPPTSRTPSTQATPTINKGKAPRTSSHEQHDESLLNGIPSQERRYIGPQFSDDALFSDESPPRKVLKDKMKVKSKRKEGRTLAKRKKRPTTWLDFFSRVFILSFLIYSLSVCPSADKQTSPVCSALSEYRRLILEPYVISPVQNFLHHPSVTPYTVPVVEKVQPVIAWSRQEWNSRAVPQWNALVVSQWEKHLIPQWNAHVSPHLARLDAKLGPYRQHVAEMYSKHGAPYVKQSRMLVYKTRPYVIVAAAKTYDTYQSSKPFLTRLYRELQRVPPLLVKYAIKPLASARRRFVDPHVALLWEKIEELSSGTAKEPHVAPDASEVTSPLVVTPKVSNGIEGLGKSVEVGPPIIPKASCGNDPLASAPSVAAASSSLGSSAGENTAETATPFNPLVSASSMMSASLSPGSVITESVPGATYSPKQQAELEFQALLSKSAESERETKIRPKTVYFTENGYVEETVVVQDAATETLKAPAPGNSAGSEELAPSNIVDAASGEVSEGDVTSVWGVSAQDVPAESQVSAPIDIPKPHRPPHPIASPVSASNDDDLDELLAELELDMEETVSSDVPPTPSVVEETEEQRVAREGQRLAEIAEKRRELEARHAKWEEKLTDAIKVQNSLLKDALASIRRTGAAELKINLAIRATIENLNSEAEKALRGTDAYFTKLRRGGKPRAEQARLWDRVLEKVQAKFDERVGDVEETVNKWYQEEVLSKEGQGIEKASDVVRNVADEAQADIGLDYAWLDDVTYMDWKRYHALLDKHQAFLDESLALSNGSHENAYPNAVLDAFEDLQAEVRDITLGFETRMRRIKREGERAFAEEQPESERFEPEISTLPMTNTGKKEDAVPQEVADAIIGRSEEEVAAAFDRADEQQPKAVHEEL